MMSVKNHYLSLQQGAECQVTYVWVHEDSESVQCKTRTLNEEPAGIEDVPGWITTSEALVEYPLAPVRMFRDPFTLDPNKLVLCEVMNDKWVPSETNQRAQCREVMEAAKEFEPWFGMEQEFILFGLDGKPYCWPEGWKYSNVACGVGSDKVHGRDISTCHYKACLYAGVKIFGTNAESVTSQWEFQVGPCEGIELGDHMWMARFILHRVCEDFGVLACLDVKPINDDHCISGCHSNFSTKEMRREGGLQHIEEAIRRLSKRHSQHLRVYDLHGGADGIRRLTSGPFNSSFQEFTSAVGRRDVSVRIPVRVFREGCGYLEDRRPAANCDPYMVMKALVETCLLGVSEQEEDERKE